MAAEPAGATGPPRSLRVLIVDDHDVVHWGFRLMLGQQSWVERTLSARTGSEAVALAERYEPHVALVDLFVGDESGPEIADRLRALAMAAADPADLRRGPDLAERRERRGRRGLRAEGLAGARHRRRRPARRPRADGLPAAAGAGADGAHRRASARCSS